MLLGGLLRHAKNQRPKLIACAAPCIDCAILRDLARCCANQNTFSRDEMERQVLGRCSSLAQPGTCTVNIECTGLRVRIPEESPVLGWAGRVRGIR